MSKSEKKDIKILCDLTKCVACKACEIACALSHSTSKNIYKFLKNEPLPKKRVRVEAAEDTAISVHCQHCKDALCVTACMSKAMHKDKKTNSTKHDKDKCVGCWMCIMACPFGAIVMDKKEKIAVKCDLCPERDDYACVAACPTKALFSGTEKEFRKKIENKVKTK